MSDTEEEMKRAPRDARPHTNATTPTDPPTTPEGERVAKAMARAGVASRRDAEAMIEAGRVTLNGRILDSPAINVTDADRITVDGEPLPARERTRLWILHKPRGVVTTARDPEGRQTVFDVLPEDLPRVVAIGRLDINTEGLLLLTNDGGLAKVIAHPETGWLRRYRVRAFGDITQDRLDRLRKGVTIEGMEYGPVEATLDRAQGDNVWITLGLREGKNREVKRILEHLGLAVNRLIRLSFGPFQLGDLEVGLVEEVRTKVLKEQLGKTLADQAGVDFESPVREPIRPFGKPKQPATAPVAKPAALDRRKRDRTPSPPVDERRQNRPQARAAVPPRVPTGGTGPGPRQSTWHADDAQGKRAGTRIPRRGSDPTAARAAAAERGRERVGAIRTGERRVLVERLQASPEVPAPKPHRRVRFRVGDDGDAAVGGPHKKRSAARPPARSRSADRDDRPHGSRRSGKSEASLDREESRNRPSQFEREGRGRARQQQDGRSRRRPEDGRESSTERSRQTRKYGDRTGGAKPGGAKPGGKGQGGKGPRGKGQGGFGRGPARGRGGEGGAHSGLRGPPPGSSRPDRGR